MGRGEASAVSRSRLGFGAETPGRGGRKRPKGRRRAGPDPPGPESDDFFDGVFGVFSLTEAEAFEREDPDVLVPETVDAVLTETRATTLPTGVVRRADVAKKRAPLCSAAATLFLKRRPFLFLVELLARADTIQPGVFGESGGVEKAEALRAPFFRGGARRRRRKRREPRPRARRFCVSVCVSRRVFF